MSFESPAKGFPWWRRAFCDRICVRGLVGHCYGSVLVALFLLLSMKFCWSQNITPILDSAWWLSFFGKRGGI